MKLLKRHPALIELSRDHYHSLSLYVRLLRTPAENHRAEPEPHFPELLEYFLEEKTSFTPHWLRIDNALRECSETDHVELRTVIAAPEHTSETWNRDFTTTLRDHTRFGERELFPAVEVYLDTPE